MLYAFRVAIVIVNHGESQFFYFIHIQIIGQSRFGYHLDGVALDDATLWLSCPFEIVNVQSCCESLIRTNYIGVGNCLARKQARQHSKDAHGYQFFHCCVIFLLSFFIYVCKVTIDSSKTMQKKHFFCCLVWQYGIFSVILSQFLRR